MRNQKNHLFYWRNQLYYKIALYIINTDPAGLADRPMIMIDRGEKWDARKDGKWKPKWGDAREEMREEMMEALTQSRDAVGIDYRWTFWLQWQSLPLQKHWSINQNYLLSVTVSLQWHFSFVPKASLWESASVQSLLHLRLCKWFPF